MVDENPVSNIEIPPALRQDLVEADAHPEIVVLYDPPAEVLEAYGLEAGLGVIAVVSSGAHGRAQALERGALEVLDPGMEEEEARVRLQTAVARFRSRLQLEQAQEELDDQADALEQNLQLAAQLQRSFLPRQLPEMPEVSFSTAYLPQEFVSGDSYEVRRLGPHHVAIYTLDAVGHGVRAGLLTMHLRSEFRPMEGGRLRTPERVLSDLNSYLLAGRLVDSPTAAFCYALLDVKQGKLQIANAGHPLPIRMKAAAGPGPVATTALAPIGGSGLLLGVDPEEYKTAEVELAPGDRVFLFTDGANPGYGDEFVEQLRLHSDLDLEDQVGGALGAVIELDEEGRPEDDITVVAMEYRGGG